MALFNFGKKKEEKAESCCCCNNSAPSTEISANTCCGENVQGICCIKVLGAGCKSCHEQYENTKAAVSNLGLSIDVEYITDMEKIMDFGVMSMPAIVINETVASMGKVLKTADVEKLLKKYGA